MAVKVQGEDSVARIRRFIEYEFTLVDRLRTVGCPYIVEIHGRSYRQRNTAPLAIGYLYMEWVRASPLRINRLITQFGCQLYHYHRHRMAVCTTLLTVPSPISQKVTCELFTAYLCIAPADHPQSKAVPGTVFVAHISRHS
jgi:hypothetical protein